jgi:hypothetical protein
MSDFFTRYYEGYAHWRTTHLPTGLVGYGATKELSQKNCEKRIAESLDTEQ